MILSVLVIVNSLLWTSLPAKAVELEQTFQPLELSITTMQADFQSVPFRHYPEHQQTRISDEWLDANVVPLATSSDIVAFIVEPEQWKTNTAHGYAHNGRAVITGTANEEGWFHELLSHEIAHKLYALKGKEDKTHALIAKHGAGNWLPYFFDDYITKPDDALIAGLVKFILAEQEKGNAETVAWAVKELIRIAK